MPSQNGRHAEPDDRERAHDLVDRAVLAARAASIASGTAITIASTVQ